MEVAVALAKVANPRAVASAGSICARSMTAVTMAMSSSVRGNGCGMRKLRTKPRTYTSVTRLVYDRP